MKLLIEVENKNKTYLDKVDGIILPLENYAVECSTFFTLDEIKEISNTKKMVFVKINKNLLNSDIEKVKEILIELDKLNISGVFFYDIAILELKRELNLKIDLVWNQTYMVNNYKTCDYYYSKGVKYALLGKEITLEEIKEIITLSKISSMVEVISKPSVAFSKRKLITNYCHDLGIDFEDVLEIEEDALEIEEKVTKNKYLLLEDKNGTSIFLDVLTNGTKIIKPLYEASCEYIIIKEFGISDIFEELIEDTKKYIDDGCKDNSYIKKYEKLGDSTNFFFKKTIYKVKKNEKN